ncbi:MAG: NAD(P)-dependent oxidoreductase [Micropepsaceae bacterium]
MSEAGLVRVAGRLPTEGVEVITIDGTGKLARSGKPVQPGDVDPEVFWLSLDLYRSGQLPAFFGQILSGTRGKWAQSFSAGIDNVAFTRIMQKGLRLTKSSAQAPAIAEYVMCHALSLLHPIADVRDAQVAHEWKHVSFREIGSLRWLLVGFGAIGREIALRLQPFGAHLTVIRRNTTPEPLAAEVRNTGDLISLLPQSDVVVLACALNAETRGLAGQAFFGSMKPGSLLINIGRGGLVDEAELKSGLDRSQPAHAVLDVFETEPLPADAWFWNHPQVRVSAHTSAAGNQVLERGDALFLENLRRYRAGDALLNEAQPAEVGL